MIGMWFSQLSHFQVAPLVGPRRVPFPDCAVAASVGRCAALRVNGQEALGTCPGPEETLVQGELPVIFTECLSCRMEAIEFGSHLP